MANVSSGKCFCGQKPSGVNINLPGVNITLLGVNINRPGVNFNLLGEYQKIHFY